MGTFEKKTTFYRLSAVCDPRFKTRWCTSDNKEKKKVKLLCKEKITNAVASGH